MTIGSSAVPLVPAAAGGAVDLGIVPAFPSLPCRPARTVPPTRVWRRPRVRAVAAAVTTATLTGAVMVVVGLEVARSLPVVASGHGQALLWLIGTAACAAAVYLCNAVELRAAAGLGYGLSEGFAGQLAAAFGNRVLPAGLGAVGINVRFLQRAGLDRTRAITSLAVTKIVSVVAHSGLLALVLGLGTAGAASTRLPAPGRLALLAVAVALAVVAAAATAAAASARVRSTFRDQVIGRARLAGAQLAAVFACPRMATTVVGAAVGGTLAHVAALATSLAAFGLHPSPLTVTAVYLAGTSVAAAVPTPGGIGTTEAALVAGLAAAGEPVRVALAAVVAFRLVTMWLPVVPGGALFVLLRRRGAL